MPTKRLIAFVVGYLETQTAWGKIARPAQLRAAAKQMVRSHQLPAPVMEAISAIQK